MLYLGLDSGTQSTKCVVLDLETSSVLASASAAVGLLGGLPPGHVEQAPEVWIDAADLTIRNCLAQLDDAQRSQVRGIGVSAQQHGLVALNDSGDPVRPAKLWCDTSTVAQVEQFNAEFGGADELIALTGNPMRTGYTAPKILWLKQNERSNWAATRTILLPHDYLNFWLTGEKRMEFGDASGTGMFDVRTRKWSQPILDFIDTGIEEKLPPVESSRKPCGLLRDSLAKDWGLPGTVLVSAGGGDNMMAAIGTANTAPGGRLTASLGTSGTLFAWSPEPVIDEHGEVAAFCDSTDAWLPLVCTMNVTVATEQARKLFNYDHAALEAAVAATPAGAGGLLFLPYLRGERTPDLARGSGVLHGLTTANMQPAHIARAVMEGATLGLGYGLSRLRALGVKPAEIRLTGGGSRSPIWRSICADVFGVPVVALASSEGAALGAAIQAAWTERAVNGTATPLREIAARCVQLDESTRVEPTPGNRALYAETQARQTDLTRKLRSGGFF